MSAFTWSRWIASLALAVGLAGTAQAQTTVRYVHTDTLGSVVAITDQNRVVIERREYEPYGQQLTPAVQDGPGYTGHVQDAATGLTYMQQRYYCPECGRFLSVDPVIADSNTGANFNRYAYANNNPYRFTDPDGRKPIQPNTCSRAGGNSCGGSYEDGTENGVQYAQATRGPRRGGGGNTPRSSRYEVRSTAEARDLAEGVMLQNAIRQLDPSRPLPQFIGPTGGPAFNQTTNQALYRELLATRAEIAHRISNNGHSFEKHVIQRGEFSGFIRTRADFEAHANYVLNNPSASRVRSYDGATAYWHQPTRTILIVNPGASNGGTMFQPLTGSDYFENFGVGK